MEIILRNLFFVLSLLLIGKETNGGGETSPSESDVSDDPSPSQCIDGCFDFGKDVKLNLSPLESIPDQIETDLEANLSLEDIKVFRDALELIKSDEEQDSKDFTLTLNTVFEEEDEPKWYRIFEWSDMRRRRLDRLEEDLKDLSKLDVYCLPCIENKSWIDDIYPIKLGGWEIRFDINFKKKGGGIIFTYRF
ncbi:CLUMA_CG016984, isoform A [Clunio marinus]|uniref:CLUMA_CG016984, isoform A n=1 Tax=Clunio marinus TaxID=568069 RepID=A0A1J1IXF5_9DIPT|nr:CLUMA_CG016984, isoform A [Clunio marinus]